MIAREAYRQYREAVTACKGIFARGGNVTGDYGEHLVKQLYGGELLPNSHKSADVRLGDGTLLQVKTRVNKTQLGGIRSWDFDYLIGIQLNDDAEVMLAVRVPVDVCRQIAGYASHDNKFVIHLNGVLLKTPGVENVTKEFRQCNP